MDSSASVPFSHLEQHFLARCAHQFLGTEHARELLKKTSRAIFLLSEGGRANRLFGSCVSSLRRGNASSHPSKPMEKNKSGLRADLHHSTCLKETPVRHDLGRLTCLIRSCAQDLSALIQLRDHRQEDTRNQDRPPRKQQPPDWFGSWVDAPWTPFTDFREFLR